MADASYSSLQAQLSDRSMPFKPRSNQLAA